MRSRLAMRLRFTARSILIIALSLPSWGQWQRQVFTIKGNWRDQAVRHSLAYYTADPFLRDDGNILCIKCDTADGKAATAKQYSVVVHQQRVGTLAGFNIVEILYQFTDRQQSDAGDIWWKSILVQTGKGKDEYAEIYHLQTWMRPDDLKPAEVLHAGSEDVLGTRDFEGGNGGYCWEDYWWFDSAGPREVDFSAVRTAMSKQVPRHTSFVSDCWALNIPKQEISSPVHKGDAWCRPCEALGSVTAQFVIKGARAEPTKIEFVPGTD